MNKAENPCCSVESIITIDDRGQMVLPKDVRAGAGFEPGDRIAVVNWYRGNEVCCVALMKANELSGAVQTILEPIMQGDQK